MMATVSLTESDLRQAVAHWLNSTAIEGDAVRPEDVSVSFEPQRGVGTHVAVATVPPGSRWVLRLPQPPAVAIAPSATRGELTVGTLRERCSLSDADRPVVLVAAAREDAELAGILRRLAITRCYVDTNDGHGNFVSTFKVEVSRR